MYKGFLASSQDPAQLSLTVESGTKVLIGIAALYATSKGLDAATATTQVQQILDVATQGVAAGFTLYHSMQTVWGLVRKGLAYFKTGTLDSAPVVQ